MLDDRELDATSTQLRSLQASTRKHKDDLEAILKKHEDLLESYRLLKSDYEEEKGLREKYKRLSKAFPHSVEPSASANKEFVLLLVDGDQFLFKNEWFKARREGGIEAAKAVHAAVRRSELMRSQSEDCQLIVRVYANTAGVSRELGRAGVVGQDARSIAPFIAGFNSADALFDFVDAGEARENVKAKIKSTLQCYADDSRCTGVFLAAFPSPDLLETLGKRTEKICIVRAEGQNSSVQPGLTVEKLSSLFRFSSSSVDFGPFKSKDTLDRMIATTEKPKKLDERTRIDGVDSRASTICPYYLKGRCSYGDKCYYKHPAQGHQEPAAQHHRGQSEGSQQPTPSSVASATPSARDLIPVNKDGHRLDPPLPPLSDADFNEFRKRINERKLCNSYQLTDNCSNVTCEFDHTPISEDMRRVLARVARTVPCPRKGACRKADCTKGHICQKSNCAGGGRCKKAGHNIDPVVVEWVPPLSGLGAEKIAEPNGRYQSSESGRGLSPDSGVPISNGLGIDALVQGGSAVDTDDGWNTAPDW